MLSDKDRDIIFELAARLTGVANRSEVRQDSLITNIQRRMADVGAADLVAYLQYVDDHPEEHAHMISALTIHTTSWFRENPHFVAFQELLLGSLKKNEVFKVWCAACSTGEEVYSFALILEEFRRVHPGFEYQVVGSDIDPVLVTAAERAVYSEKHMNFHVSRYKHHLLEGSGKTDGFFTLAKDIRDRCKFRISDLRSEKAIPEGPFHVVVCRNVLIYFDPDTVNSVVANLVRNLRDEGRLLLGHSEAIAPHKFGLTQEGHSVFFRGKQPEEKVRIKGKPRILCIDDSLLTRKYLEKALKEMGFEVVTATSGSEATSFLNFNEVDLITLDLNMPDMSGEKWMQVERREGLKTPIVVFSEAHGAEAPAVVKLLASGAQDYIEKSRLASDPEKTKEVLLQIISASTPVTDKTAGSGNKALPKTKPDFVLMGASTGGPQALTKLLSNMPKNSPPILITQHISAKFAQPLAERLAEVSGLKLGQPRDNDPVEPGHLYMSFGDYHIGLEERDRKLVLRVSNAPAFNGHRPSVDFMFNSILGIERPGMALLLTGMGRDGALGLRFLHKEGVFCVAQSEEDCIVYGMPREAIERGAVNFVGNLDEIRELLITSFNMSRIKAA